MNAVTPLRILSNLALCALLTACAAPERPLQSGRGPVLPDPGPDREYKVQFPEPGPGATRYIRLTLADDMTKGCGLVRTHFEFDSAEAIPQDKLELKSLAECLDRPEYKALKVSLIGRADNRGDTAYNQRLGLQRAENVKKILVDAGLAPARIMTSSRGATGAVGDNATFSYGYDRRVDVVELGLVRAPE